MSIQVSAVEKKKKKKKKNCLCVLMCLKSVCLCHYLPLLAKDSFRVRMSVVISFALDKPTTIAFHN